MKKAVFFLSVMLSVALSGCATTQMTGPVTPASSVKMGMSRDQVTALLNHPVVVGVEIDPATGTTKSVEAPSLYATEFEVHNNVAYLIDFYILKMNTASSGVDSAETVPFIFENSVLVGQGREALRALQGK